ncbi:MAG: Smr/MutS family protein [Paracoccaceae bacterium]
MLNAEDQALWNRVAASADPMPGKTLKDSPEDVRQASELVAASPVPRRAPAHPGLSRAPTLPVPTKRSKPAVPTSWEPAAPEVKPVGRPQAGLDRRTSERLRRGNREPDARIDLHGMTAERAHRACLTFLSDAAARGCRMVLVITGKGGRDELGIMRNGRGVLKASLPGWLKASPLRQSIVGIYQAHQRHGGEGAFYVYLKKRR